MAKDKLRNNITSLLWKGDREGAAKLAKTEIERVKAEIEQLQQELQVLHELMPPQDIQVPAEGKKVAKKRSKKAKPLSPAEKKLRRREILDIAKRIAVQKAEFTIDDIRKEVENSDIKMGVPPNRLNTAIGNMLNSDGGYDRVAHGVYAAKRGLKLVGGG